MHRAERMLTICRPLVRLCGVQRGGYASLHLLTCGEVSRVKSLKILTCISGDDAPRLTGGPQYAGDFRQKIPGSDEFANAI